MAAQVSSVRFPGRADQVRRARNFVGSALGLEHAGREDAILLVSETVTNAVAHTGSGEPGGFVTVTVSRTDSWARVVVADAGAQTVPCFCRVGVESTAGRGSELLDACASRWGITRDPHGTRVWFDVGVAPEDAAHRRESATGVLSPAY
ncbi:histidine kinase-like protein [Actinocorallia herbida]|uniref:Histidine kinase-like protein n=1 Tax=Actinocorallia herbida TaxID=58109 RepID=A0A3N1DB52_9ACTN|nr:ATP-binding protein [Actinocorallia herbida]ROO90754.1 histidine kinase-like protein [Actinocorallia herbida]